MMTSKRFSFAAALVGVAMSAAAGGCAPADPPSSRSSPDDATDPGVVVQLLRARTPVPAFQVTDLAGRSMSSADWKSKVVIVNFWATWCLPCVAEIRDLIALQDKYRDELVIIGVSEDEGSPEAVKRFAEERKINYPIVMATPELEKIFPGVIALPTTFVLDREGRLAQRHVGLLNAKQTEGTTRALAGLSVNAKVEHVDDPSRLTAEGVAQVKNIPGVALSAVPTERRGDVLQALNENKCTCGCDLSTAKCRIEDPTCEVSLPLAKAIVEKFAASL